MRRLSVIVILVFVLECCSISRTQRDNEAFASASTNIDKKRPDLNKLQFAFSSFQRADSTATYEVKLCADVPNNKKPHKVAYKSQPGHVFLIFSQYRKSGDTVSQVFGYYPVRPASVLIFKNVKSEIRDNKGRDYDVHIAAQVEPGPFYCLLDSALSLARRKYNVNRFNCYDYGIFLFNMAANPSSHLDIQHVKFPFIWGRGGSPVGLYSQLKQLKECRPECSANICFGQLKAPL